jgi:hypothetical protein
VMEKVRENARRAADPYARAVSGVVTLTRAEGMIWVAERTRLGMSWVT